MWSMDWRGGGGMLGDSDSIQQWVTFGLYECVLHIRGHYLHACPYAKCK